MKKLYDYRMLISDDGENWYDTSFKKHIFYLNEENTQTQISKELSFDEIFDLVKNDKIFNAKYWKTCFRKRKRVKLYCDMYSSILLREGTKKKNKNSNCLYPLL